MKQVKTFKKFNMIFLMLVSTIFLSLGSLFLKLGISKGLLTFTFLLGFLFYSIGGIFLIISLKYGNLSIVYPMISLAFIWTTLLGIFYLNEKLSYVNLSGILLIILGVSLLGMKNG